MPQKIIKFPDVDSALARSQEAWLDKTGHFKEVIDEASGELVKVPLYVTKFKWVVRKSNDGTASCIVEDGEDDLQVKPTDILEDDQGEDEGEPLSNPKPPK